MKPTLLAAALTSLFIAAPATAETFSFTPLWTYNHASTGVAGMTSEVPAFDAVTNTLWLAGSAGVDVLDATNGSLVQHIDTSGWGLVNSVAISNGLAAFAIENVNRTQSGVVTLFDTSTRSLISGTNTIAVGALPDMLTFTPDGSRLLVANEGTPDVYGSRIGTSTPRIYAPAANDPVGSVSIIDVASRSVIATPTFDSAPQSGSYLRTNTGMNFEPEYIAVNAAGTQAFVGLQEANAMGVIDLNTNTVTKVIGLGAKDFSLPGNTLDPKNDGSVNFINADVKGLYMPDSMATYQVGTQTYVVMANEGDFREDDGDRSAASTLGATDPLNALRISNTDSFADNLVAAGARSFSIRDSDGNIIFDSGDILDREAHALGIYNDGRSRDKGVEPEGVALIEIDGRTFAFIGLERTTQSALAVFDITDPANSSFIDMIVTNGTFAPEGLTAYSYGGRHFLAVANEASIDDGILGTTALYEISAPVPEPESYAMLLAGLGLIGVAVRRRRR